VNGLVVLDRPKSQITSTKSQTSTKWQFLNDQNCWCICVVFRALDFVPLNLFAIWCL
jgi:hypothetical protein